MSDAEFIASLAKIDDPRSALKEVLAGWASYGGDSYYRELTNAIQAMADRVLASVQTVFVVMGNDYPDAVFEEEYDAQYFCASKENEDRDNYKSEHGHKGPGFARYVPRIYWRYYDFKVKPT